MKDLKEKTIRGAFAKLCSQGATFVLRMGSIMVMARLLEPRDFGLVNMVTAVTGVLTLFRDFGLSAASIQKAEVSDEQASTLFWINLAVGGALTILAAALGPFMARFYHEPRLTVVTAVLAAGFLINSAAAQHIATLYRQLRFGVMSGIDVVSLFVGIIVGIAMAYTGHGYWSLVWMSLTPTLVSTPAFWIASRWIPSRPRRGVGLGSLVRFGGTITLNGVIIYLANNADKVLLGRFWGATAVGIYGRAYTLISVPNDNLNSAVGGVAFSALARLQNDVTRMKSYFLKGYSVLLALTIPVIVTCALFSDDIVRVALGPKWSDAAIIFRLLAPTILVFALINPLGWFLLSTGRVIRALKLAVVGSALVVTAETVGLSHGPTGIALAYSAAMVLWAVPYLIWCLHETGISLGDVLLAFGRPLASVVVAALAAVTVRYVCGRALSPLLRLMLESLVLSVVYLLFLMFVMRQSKFYWEIVRNLLRPSQAEEAFATA
jgi:O-antigen/teichoic acid export membrane protein